MRISHWLRPLATRLSRIPTPQTRQRRTFRPHLEMLEDRTVPTTVATPAGLTNWWSADNSLADIAGQSTAVAIGGVGYAPGEVGQAFDFTGGGHVAVTGNSIIQGPRTIEGWVKLGVTRSFQDLPIIDFGDINTNLGIFGISGNYLSSSSFGELYFSNDESSTCHSTAKVTPGVWSHVAMTYDGTTVRFFINGQAAGQVDGNISDGTISDYPLNGATIGGPSDTTNLFPPTQLFFPGEIDELSLYNRALSAQEIQSIYQAGPDGKSQFFITSSSPTAGEKVGAPPTDFTLHFSQQVSSTLFQPTDLTVNGIAADTVNSIDAQTLSFHYNISPVTAAGQQTMQFGSLGWSSTFSYIAGLVTTEFNSSTYAMPGDETGAWNVAVQPNDGKIILVGDTGSAATGYHFVVARYNPNGVLDPTFGQNGQVTLNFGSPQDHGYGVTVQPDGKILVVGTTYNSATGLDEFAVARLLPNGSLDPGFSSADDNLGPGMVTVGFDGVDIAFFGNLRAQLQGNQIVLSDSRCNGNLALARLNSDGSVDNSFGTAGNGRVLIPVGGIYSLADTVIEPSGKIVIADETGRVFRLNSDGSPDSTFSNQTLDFSAGTVILDAQGNLLIGGRNDEETFTHQDWVVARLGADGNVDTNFGTGGEAQISIDGSTHEALYYLAVQANGKIIADGWRISGGIMSMIAARLTPDGQLDTSFGSQGSVVLPLDDVGNVVVAPDGGILIPGTVYQSSAIYDFAMARLPEDSVQSPPISVQIVGPKITSSGQVSFSAKVAGPTSGDEQAGYDYTIDWGDGTAQAPDLTTVAASAHDGNGSLVLPSHTYAPGIYTVSLTATDQAGLSKATTALVLVSNTPNDSISVSGGDSAGQVAITEGGHTLPTPGTYDQVLIAGSGGSDVYTVNFGGNLIAPITLAGSGTDSLFANGSSGDNNIVKQTGSTSTISWGPQAGNSVNPLETVSYAGIGNVTINGGSGNNYITDPGSNTTINGGPGQNTIVITATSGNGVVINGGGSDTYEIDLGNLAGPVSIQNSNTNATDNLIVNGATGNNTINVAGNQITEGTQTITDTAALANLTVNGGSGTNQMTVSALTVPVTNVTLAGGSGTNTYTVNAGSTVSIVAGTGDNILNVNGGTVASITAPAGVSVPIVFASNYTVFDNGKLSVAAATGVLANDLSTNGQPLTAVLATGPAHGILSLNADGSFVYTPAANFVGFDNFTYRAKGSDGSLSALATVTIHVSYKFSGFLPPLSNGLVFAVNRTIPIKFSLSDANGNAVTSLSAVTSLQIQALDANGNPIGNPFNPTASGNTGLSNSGGQYLFNWQTKGLAAGSYQIVLTLADGTTRTKTIQLTASGSSAGLVTDGSGGTATAGALLGGEVDLYVDNSNGELTSDELARIQDAVTTIDATIAPYGVVINEVSDPTQSNVTLNMNTTSSLGGTVQGVLGCTTDADQVTMIQGWNWYAGSDPTQVGAGQYDFETAVVHELGHVLGLGHSSSSTSVMYASLATGTANHALTTADLNVPDNDCGPCALHAAPAPVVSSTSNSQGVSAPSSTSVPSSGSPTSAPDQLFANFTLVLNEMRNGNQPAWSSVAALWQSIDALALQRLDLLLSMEAGAMGVTKDNLMRELFFAPTSASNGV